MTDFKRKLAAYLHDPPSKALDIKNHGERSDAAFRCAGFIDTEVGDYFKMADHTAAAADRLPFPASQISDLHCAFDGIRNGFLHPLNGAKLRFHAEFKSAEQGIEGEKSVQPVLTVESLASLPEESLRWRARFFAHWRLWPKHATEKDYRLSLLPADTRIPDHSIWTHMQMVSAFDGCMDTDKGVHPAFLKFQLGPVQDFIAASRSIRDLWSGSYLLSWLMAAGLKELAGEVGPDAVIFPNLRDQPLFDLHWRDELWSKVKIGSPNVWDSLGWKNQELLTPNLPNIFLAVVPAERAAELGKMVGETIQKEWRHIAETVWTKCQEAGLTDDESGIKGIKASDRKARFDAQISHFLSVSWQATPWPNSLENALKLAEGFAPEMPIQEARKRVQSLVDMAEKHMQKDHRDVRNFERVPKGQPNAGWKDRSKLKDDAKLDNIGLGWSVILALNSWALDATRQTRHFDAANTGGWQTGAFNDKDVLTGRDEAVAGGQVWTKRAEDYARTHNGPWKSLFKHGDWLSAATLVKRLWHFTYLAQKPWSLETASNKFPIPDIRNLAAHRPDSKDDDADNEKAAETDSSEKYFAVLVLDGDEIGKWVSGEKTPLFSSQLADYSDSSNAQRYGAKHYFEKPEFGDFLKTQRPLSPSYHLQFGEALNNFALRCARLIVETFDGRLIYAGGDDVVALLPADTALACSKALRLAFRGCRVEAPKGKVVFESPQQGFLSSDQWKDDHGHGRPIPFLVPGPAADCSIGIAIAHFKAPLQDVVRAAQAAEKRAKNQLGRSAVAVSLFKRSGEIIEWGCKWESGGLDLYHAIAAALDDKKITAKFPYRVVELLEPYRTSSRDLARLVDALSFDAAAVIQKEFAHVLSRQSAPGQANAMRADLEPKLNLFLVKTAENWDILTASDKRPIDSKCQHLLKAIIGLCQTVAFAHRTRDKDSQSTASQALLPAERQTQS